MKTRSSLFILTAITALSASALAPTQASAWGMQGNGGGYHFGGYNSMSYFRPSYRPQFWAQAPLRQEYRPREYRRYVTFSTSAIAPAPTVAYAPAPAATYAPAPTVIYAPAPTVTYAPPTTATYQQTYTPKTTYAPQPAPAPCSGAASAPQTYTSVPQQQVYAPQQQLGAPCDPAVASYQTSQPQPSQDRKPAIYASTELQK